MSNIYFAISTLFLISTISALAAPAVVYSAAIYNEQNSPIECEIIWSNPLIDQLQTSLFTVDQHKYYLINEKINDMGTWKSQATIQEIHCGKLTLSAPFEHVDSPKKNWKFFVQLDKIISVDPKD